MTKIVLDTDVLIDVLRGREVARSFLQDAADRFVPCCSVISVAELYAGMRLEEEAGTRTLLDGLVTIPVTREIAEVAGRFKKSTTSRRLEQVDCLIAATACKVHPPSHIFVLSSTPPCLHLQSYSVLF